MNPSRHETASHGRSATPRAGSDLAERLELRGLAESLATSAAGLVRERLEEVRSGRVPVMATKSSATDAVTAIDVASEEHLRERIAAERPGDGVLGEEGDPAVGESGVTWVVDPIDGTVNFIYGIPRFAVSVAAVSGGTDPATWCIEAGAVADIPRGTLYSAARGAGAFKDGAPLRPAPRADLLPMALVGTGFGYTAQARRVQGETLARLLPRIRDVRRLGSAALDICSVAEGSLDAYYESGLHPWDWAAAALVATESGCAVRGGGAAPGEDLVTVGPPVLLEALRAELMGARVGAVERD